MKNIVHIINLHIVITLFILFSNSFNLNSQHRVSTSFYSGENLFFSIGEINVPFVNIATHSINQDRPSIMVYPNPADDKLFIEFDTNLTFDYSIISIDGKHIKSGSATKSEFVDLSIFSKGIYILKCSFDGTCIFKKIIIN